MFFWQIRKMEFWVWNTGIPVLMREIPGIDLEA
jgi:hypothetical protein